MQVTLTSSASPPSFLPVNTLDPNQYQLVLEECLNNYSNEDWDLVLQTCLPVIEQAELQRKSDNLDNLYAAVGQAYSEQSRFTLATEKYLLALKYAKQQNDVMQEGFIYSELGGLYFDQKQFNQALEAFQNALAISEKYGPKLNVATDLSNIAATYESMWELDRAIEVYAEALAIRDELGDDPTNLAGKSTILGNLGWLYRRKGEPSKALEYFDQAIALKRQLGLKYSLVYSLNNRGYTFEEANRDSDAISDYIESVGIVEEILAQQSTDNALMNLSSQVPMVWPYERLAALLVKEKRISEAFNYAERGRAILTRNSLGNISIDFRENLDPKLLLQEEYLRAKLAIAQKQMDDLYMDSSVSAEQIQDAEANLHAARTRYQEHLEIMQLQGGYLNRKIVFETASLIDIQRILPPDTTLVMYEISNRFNSVVFLITNNSVNARNLDFITEDIEPRVSRFMSDRLANQGEMRTIYDYAIFPIEDLLTTSRLIIAADGPLNYVPFAALQSSDGNYLVDKYVISMIPSATVLRQLVERTGFSVPAVRSSGLVLSQSYAPGYSDLKNSDAEANAIGGILNVQPINNATENDLWSYASNSRVIHVSAHVELDPNNPLFSAIRLREDGGHDGRVNAYEIAELDLRYGTELVVLSGCNTASGDGGNSSDDFNTLVRSFFTAGVPRVVASLWSVDDKATKDLLINYFVLRKSYNDDALALRDAMILTRSKYPEVYFWGSFTLNGIP